MQAGDIIAQRFELEQQVAAGGMGRVFRAADRLTGEQVAVKLLSHPEPQALERFLQEAVALAEIQHPGVVRYTAHGRMGACDAYLAMEWLEGVDLAHHLEPDRPALWTRSSRPGSELDGLDTIASDASSSLIGTAATAVATMAASELRPASPSGSAAYPEASPLPPGRTLDITGVVVLGRRLASTVAELHRHAIVHRDIKPANVFLCSGDVAHAKLLDLGTIRRLGRHSTQERDLLIGTPVYMAPEQARVDDHIGPEADVWAIGCVLYECLTGTPPFNANHTMAVLTRILVDEPEPIQALRGDVPDDLASLIMRTLAKDPQQRPRDGEALSYTLENLGTVSRIVERRRSTNNPIAQETPAATSPAITSVERRVTSMLFADAPRDAAPGATPAATPAAIIDGKQVRRMRERFPGVAIQRLASGTLLVTAPSMLTPTDQATRIARVALALRDASPEGPQLAMVIATDYTEGSVPLGRSVSEAAHALEAVSAGAIWLDRHTVPLLDARFLITEASDQSFLYEERSSEAPRTLLGKPSQCVGREAELSALLELCRHSIQSHRARAALVTAPAGMGKSRLRSELERAIRRNIPSDQQCMFFHGHGDAVSAGAPFIMIAPGVRKLAGILDGEPLDMRRHKLHLRLNETVPAADLNRVSAFLGELVGVPFPTDLPGVGDALRAGRKDPMLMGQLMQAAWIDWVRAECARGPVVLILEDIHWGDLPSVTYLDKTLEALADQPLCVVALARPEVHGVFPQLWSRHEPYQLELRPLTPAACAALVRHALSQAVPDDLVRALTERSGGNAFYLEELIRAVAESGSLEASTETMPDTVLGMVHARLDSLSSEAKRILRAGSIFGEVFWHGGITALLGHSGAFDISEYLGDLVAREIITRMPAARVPGETEYRFRHALVRDGAYAMLTSGDRRLGHAVAAEWLLAAGEQDGLILAEHFMRGGDRARAIPYYYRAAEQALEGSDLAAVIDRAERAVEAGASGTMLGRLRSLQSVAAYWSSDYAGGQRAGIAAAGDLVPGTGAWFVAVGSALVSSARLSDYEHVDALFADATAATCEPGAEAEQLICLCRGTFQLIFAGRFHQADLVLLRIASLAREAHALDALTRAQVEHVQGVRAAHIGDVSTFLTHLQAAVEAFERAGDVRNVLLERTTVAWSWAELGYFEHAAALCERNLAQCIQQKAQQAITYARVNLGFILTGCPGRLDEARAVLAAAIHECCQVGNTRLEGWARAHLGAAWYRSGDVAAAEREARCAVTLLAASPGLQAWAQAILARALVGQGRAADAYQPAHSAMDVLRQLGGLLQGESLPPLAWAQTLAACGDTERARAAAAEAHERLMRRASRLTNPAWRDSFLAIPDNRETRELIEGAPDDRDP